LLRGLQTKVEGSALLRFGIEEAVNMQAKHATASILGSRSGAVLLAAAIAGGPVLAAPALARANRNAFLKPRDKKWRDSL